MKSIISLITIGVLSCTVCTSCSTSSAIKAATGLVGSGKDTGITAQVGSTNTKQGLGATLSNDDRNETTVKNSTVGTISSSKGTAQKANNISTGTVSANSIVVKSSNSTSLVISFIVGGALVLLTLFVLTKLLIIAIYRVIRK